MHGPEIFEDILEYLWYIELYVIQSYTVFRFSPCFSSWKSTNLYFSWGHTSRRCWAIMGVALKHLERTQNHPQLWRWMQIKQRYINLQFAFVSCTHKAFADDTSHSCYCAYYSQGLLADQACNEQEVCVFCVSLLHSLHPRSTWFAFLLTSRVCFGAFRFKSFQFSLS